jgi:hypothetical protein
MPRKLAKSAKRSLRKVTKSLRRLSVKARRALRRGKAIGLRGTENQHNMRVGVYRLNAQRALAQAQDAARKGRCGTAISLLAEGSMATGESVAQTEWLSDKQSATDLMKMQREVAEDVLRACKR